MNELKELLLNMEHQEIDFIDLQTYTEIVRNSKLSGDKK